MTVIELAVYAAVLGGAQPMLCRLEDATVKCTNGYAAAITSESTARFSDGTTVGRDDKGFPVFSNGIHSWFDSARWLQFSNGTTVRKMPGDEFRFGNGLICRSEMPALVNCRK